MCAYEQTQPALQKALSFFSRSDQDKKQAEDHISYSNIGGLPRQCGNNLAAILLKFESKFPFAFLCVKIAENPSFFEKPP